MFGEIKRLRITAGSLLLLTFGIVVNVNAQTPDYLNPDLPVDQRVEDLISRMTLEEKAQQMLDRAPAIDRLGVPEYNWWNEALHGVARSGLATSYPQAIGFASTWNEELIFEMANSISDEARAKHHDYERKGSRLRYQGLTMWSPNINIFRDPRWGRGQETYGEDPFLTGRLAVNFVKGLQGDDPTYFKTVATVKHFAVHNGPEPLRHTFDAIPDERDLRETYLPMFKEGILEGGAYSLMCAYNRVNGDPACASDELLVDILRGEWAFDGFIVSDCWALDDIYRNHKVVDTAAEAAAMALKSGTDLDCGTLVYPYLVEAVEKGYITEDEVDVSLKRLFEARFRLGMFDPAERVEYQNIPYSVVDSEEHRELALKVTRESMVLLKNDGVLPFSKDIRKIAVIGPNADQEMVLLGNYNGIPSEIVTPLEGIQAAVSGETEVLYSAGSSHADGFPLYEVIPGAAFYTPDGKPGLKAEYFNDRELTGEPLFSETVASLNANWRDKAPREDMDGDDFGVRWTGVIKPEVTEEYQLGMWSTMKYELYFEDSLLSRSMYNYRDEFGDPRLIPTRKLQLEAGKEYKIKIEAHESYADAEMRMVWTTPTDLLQDEALNIAEDADAIVLVMGLTPRLEGEEMRVEIDGFNGGDRTDIDLPDTQKELIQKVTALGKPTALVLLNGSALAVEWSDENVPAILEAWYGGQAGGTAIADVLFGDYNPAGRLPVTFYKSVDDLPPFEDYNMDNRTYRYFEGEALYPFGHGLSYTDFEYSPLDVSRSSLTDGEELGILVQVTNTGDVDGDEVVQLYVSYPESEVERPIRDLRGFDRIHLKAGESKTVKFTLKAEDLKYWDPDTDEWVLEETQVLIQAGASSADIRQDYTIEVRN
jgi:beta-glucosidase